MCILLFQKLFLSDFLFTSWLRTEIASAVNWNWLTLFVTSGTTFIPFWLIRLTMKFILQIHLGRRRKARTVFGKVGKLNTYFVSLHSKAHMHSVQSKVWKQFFLKTGFWQETPSYSHVILCTALKIIKVYDTKISALKIHSSFLIQSITTRHDTSGSQLWKGV